MRILLSIAIVLGAAAMSVVTPVAVSPAAAEPDDGVSRCGADGYVERYSTLTHGWQPTATRCR